MDQTLSQAKDIVTTFLEALAARDLGLCSSLVAEEVSFVFPGGRAFGSLREVFDNSRRRYRHVAKDIEAIESYPAGEGVVVYCYGTLHGTRATGEVFSGVRFIDRFELRDGRIVDQRVWNDTGATAREPAAAD